MMSMNVKDYLKIYDDFIDKKLCKKIVKNLNKIDWQTHSFHQPTTNQFVSYEKELSIS
jgi:hypothetical protein